jgi:hypothetical protein
MNKKYIILFLLSLLLLSLLFDSSVSKESMENKDDKGDIGEQETMFPLFTLYAALKYHMEDAYFEKNMEPDNVSMSPDVAIFSLTYYNDITNITVPFNEKKYDFCFIGSINSSPSRRLWVIEFAKKYFTSNSIFVNTDIDTNWELLGDFDLSDKNLGFAPKYHDNMHSREAQMRKISENEFYFKTMCNSKFILCPAGDAPWSFRFYETLMCRSLPIVETKHHTFRTDLESGFGYRYLLFNNIDKIRYIKNDESKYNIMIEENNKIFREHHLLQ